MTSRFVLSPEAASDLRELIEFIAEDNPDAARRFLARLRGEMERIVATPGIGHRREDLTEQPVRFWPVGRYLVIYRQEGQDVEVVRVLHGARDVAALLDS